MIYKLIKPIEFDGKKITELNLDFESLSGSDMISAERQFIDNNGDPSIAIKEYSKEFQLYIAARAAKEPPEALLKLSVPDFSAITIKVQSFFLGGDIQG